MDATRQPLTIARAAGEFLYDHRGRAYLDLFSANGTTWLGQAHPAIRAAVAAQLESVWTTGALGATAVESACRRLAAWLPASHYVAGLYSTGMEAAEFAGRVARVATGRPGAVGFARSMHGKSLAMSSLAWDNPGVPAIQDWHRLPFTSQSREAEILDRLRAALATARVAAVFVEPWQATGGGHTASREFFEELGRLCRQHGALVVFDELLTGFYRTGTPFFFSRLGYVPDVILLGKSLGNGFPVSAVALNRQIEVVPRMLPGSTYANNSLAAAAVDATLTAMEQLDLKSLVERIETIMGDRLAPLTDCGCAVRGIGTMWIVETPAAIDLPSTVEAIYNRQVAVGYTANCLRLLPPVTIAPQRLAEGCRIVAEALIAAAGRTGAS